MESSYRKTQISPWMIALMAGSALGFFAVSFVLPAPWHWAGVAGAVLFAGLGWLFSSLTVRITPTQLVWYFGPGLWTYQLSLQELRSAEPVRNPWWYGWGIRRVPSGWLYNIAGLSAVEITLADDRKIRIGSDEPEQLSRAIHQTLK